MKLSAALALCLIVIFGLGIDDGAFAQTTLRSSMRMRTVDATDTCLSNCSSQSASCKRACPATFSTPCNSSCDSQEQVCRQSCGQR